jgi:hypothetical protein
MSKICRTFAAKLERIIMKAMYKKPITEVTSVNTEELICTANNSIMHGGPGTGNEGGDIE